MTYDWIILGSGPGGSSVAKSLAKDGKKIAVIDPIFGGSCALRGCTPKKVMESVTSAYWQAKDHERHRFPKSNDFVDWHLLQARKDSFIS
ncbi:MAG: dihydrolipoamide dehydrogenase [Saprospiraceae bacterium]|jgi:dihydrolipoamide dehydrogenase|tara:strand:+ start:104 stop:373 length:270 start_codon:yes stop_codon:yes gene_type:complete